MEGELNTEQREVNSLSLQSLIESNSFVINNFLLQMFCFSWCFLCHVMHTCGSLPTEVLCILLFDKKCKILLITTIQNLGKNKKKLNLTHDGSKQLNSAALLHQ